MNQNITTIKYPARSRWQQLMTRAALNTDELQAVVGDIIAEVRSRGDEALRDYARRFAERIYEITKGNVNLCMAATFDGGVYFPQAACAEIFWDPTRTYGAIMKAAADKAMVTLN